MKQNITKGRRAPKRRKGALGLIVVLLVLALLVIASVIGVGMIKNEIKGERRLGSESQEITIAEGTSDADIFAQLYAAKIINSQSIFKYFVKFGSADVEFQFGTHILSPDMPYEDIIWELEQPREFAHQGTLITFPEGTTSLKMALILEEQGFCTVQEFVDACNNDIYDVPFYSLITENPNKFIKIEGFLFPDTYELEEGITAHDIIQMMLENFNEKVWNTDLRAQIENSGFSLEEIITIAAIVQKEAFNGEEYNVSSVFHNRLMPGSPVTMLQSDTTWQFQSGVLNYYYSEYQGGGKAPQAMLDAYDSYKVEGLIVGPTCNPGWNCIDAAANPNDTPYYFFLTNNAKEFRYAVTGAEHEANVRWMQETNAALAKEQSASAG